MPMSKICRKYRRLFFPDIVYIMPTLATVFVVCMSLIAVLLLMLAQYTLLLEIA